jgi:hypothetical protein
MDQKEYKVYIDDKKCHEDAATPPESVNRAQ